MNINKIENDSAYFLALESAYNVIFEVNRQARTVEVIYGKESSDIGKLADIDMTIDSAIKFWVNNYIIKEDRQHMLTYLNKIVNSDANELAEKPAQTEFQIIWDNGKLYSFICVAMELNPDSILVCCRDTGKVKFSGYQVRMVEALHELHVMMDEYYNEHRKCIGGAFFRTRDNEHFKLVYASKTICKELGIREHQYIRYIEEGFDIEEIRHLADTYKVTNVDSLFMGHQLTMTDKDGEDFYINCHHIDGDVHEFTISKVNDIERFTTMPQKGIFARTFGYFDLFVDGEAVVFSGNKEKELLALLIDRNGGTLTSDEAISILWEIDCPDEKTHTRYRKLALGLKRTLEKYNAGYILNNHNGVRSINTVALTCDYYELLAGNSQYINSFHNSYMTDYSWSERTLGTLWDFS